MAQSVDSKSANLLIDYPDRDLNRLTAFFRILFIIAISIIIGLLINHSVGIVFLPLVLMILFHKKYPRWWFDWNLAMIKLFTRVDIYSYLLIDVSIHR